MKPTISAFKQSPDRGQGLARDFRVRWALEEVGQDYEVRLETFPELKAAPYLAVQPFGQIPSYEAGDLVLFESGGIVHHIAERHPGLLPDEPNARARAVSWMFAALNTVEPPIVEASLAGIIERDKWWFEDRQEMLMGRVRGRLDQLAAHLGDADWLDGDFSAADLLMVTVLRRAQRMGALDGYPTVEAYVARAEGRPAYQRAFAAQLKVFEDSQKG